jgi:hypothetical protein
VNRFCQAQGDYFLAHALHTDEKVGMMQSSADQGSAQGFQLFVMTQDLRKTHLTKLSINDDFDLLCDIPRRTRSVNNSKPLRFGPCQLKKARPHSFVKFEFFPFKPILSILPERASRLPLGGSRQTDFHGAVKQKGQARLDPSAGYMIEVAEYSEIYSAPIPLVGKCRVGVPIAKNDFASFERGSDDFVDMLRTVRQVQE